MATLTAFSRLRRLPQTSGNSYTENALVGVHAVSTVEIYGDDPYTVLQYTLMLRRSQSYYIFLVIIPCLMFSLLSFSVFWLSHEVGERLGFGITLILATEVFKVVISGMVPVCGEMLWIDLFTNACSLFCIISLIESCVVLSFAYRGSEAQRTEGDDEFAQKSGMDGVSRAAIVLTEIEAEELGIGLPSVKGASHQPKRTRVGSAFRGVRAAVSLQGIGRIKSPPPSPPEASLDDAFSDGGIPFSSERRPHMAGGIPSGFIPPGKHRVENGDGASGSAYGGYDAIPVHRKRTVTRRRARTPKETTATPSNGIDTPSAHSTAPELTPDPLFGSTDHLAATTSPAGDRSAGRPVHNLAATRMPISEVRSPQDMQRRWLRDEELKSAGTSPTNSPKAQLTEDLAEESRQRNVRISALPMSAERFTREEFARTSVAFKGSMRSSVSGTTTKDEWRTLKLLRFEELFLRLDTDGTGSLDVNFMLQLLSFVAMDKSPHERMGAVVKHVPANEPVQRLQFVRVCAQLLMDTPVEQLEMGALTLLALMKSYEGRYRQRWLEMSRSIDKWSRVIIPSCFFAVQLFLFGIDLCDYYIPLPGENATCASRYEHITKLDDLRPGTAVRPGLLQAMFDGFTPIWEIKSEASVALVIIWIAITLYTLFYCVWRKNSSVLEWRRLRRNELEWKRLQREAQKQGKFCERVGRDRTESEAMATLVPDWMAMQRGMTVASRKDEAKLARTRQLTRSAGSSGSGALKSFGGNVLSRMSTVARKTSICGKSFGRGSNISAALPTTQKAGASKNFWADHEAHRQMEVEGQFLQDTLQNSDSTRQSVAQDLRARMGRC